MSMIHFLDNPFPDNHDGFDYAPKSFSDVQKEHDAEVQQKQNAASQKKMLNMFASIFK